MHWRIWTVAMPLVVGGLTCVLALSAGRPAGAGGCCAGEEKGGKGKKKDPKGPCEGKVCPLYCWGHFGTYCSYYSKECDTGRYVNLNTTCGLTSNNCVEPCTGCEFVGSFRLLKGPRRFHFHKKDLEKGIMRKAEVPNPLQANVTPVGSPVFAWLRLKKDTASTERAKVKLYLALVKPPDLPEQVLSTGLEIESPMNPPVEIPYDNIVETRNRLCVVQYGPVLYEVILDKSSDLEQLPVAGKK